MKESGIPFTDDVKAGEATAFRAGFGVLRVFGLWYKIPVIAFSFGELYEICINKERDFIIIILVMMCRGTGKVSLTSAVRRGVSALHIGEGAEELGRVVQIPGPQTVRLPLPQPRTGGGERRSLHVSLQSTRVVRANVTTLR